jgi:GNAT superfamily N-acetyltransferase
MLRIRKATASDLEAMHAIFESIVKRGDTYPFGLPVSHNATSVYWLGPGIKTYLAEYKDRIVGMYRLVPNQPDRGAHVANASFMTDPRYQGQGIGQAMGKHCLKEASKVGYLAMQFNFVVSSNKAALALWKKLGFKIVGRIPKAFKHKKLGYVDAYIMHRFLGKQEE